MRQSEKQCLCECYIELCVNLNRRKSTIFCNATPYGVVKILRCFRGQCCLRIPGQKDFIPHIAREIFLVIVLIIGNLAWVLPALG
jgi:hypothetical protein